MNKLLIFIGIVLASCNPKPNDSATMQTKDIGAVIEENKVRSIKSGKAKAILIENDGIEILDVRTPQEYSAGHLKGAQHVDFYLPDFSKRLQALSKDKLYLVYCASGGRSKKAAKMMAELGFSKVYNVSEGFSALKEAGIPVE